ncbi:M14 family metallopeptidase [Leeia aquatica]|uniref:Carboxypeptidase family protein n=1 Tax=Leeia aquatica TaxID=2725557 RepID=A0A847S492_9NEIS|nr:M14-type cytosolic carboxypeptidase [Leeia aquatica]NLR76561.1 carboxypeptidase family protein [Leeia aquatica]
MKISSCFDAGSIVVDSMEHAGDIRLQVRHDSNSEFAQWFYFRLQGAAGQACQMRFLNAAQCAYPKGWVDYQAVASYDRQHWFRVPTQFDGQVLTIQHTPEEDSIYYAYFEPYSWERHLQLIGQAQSSPRCKVRDLGNTLDGRDLNLLVIGDEAPGKRKVWLTARQHPGETMAEWFVEGTLSRLLDEQDALAGALLDKATFYVVPNMNPDGSCRGNLRTNAAGTNLNREWANPTMEKSPEVWLVREAMREIGVDLYLDAHGDEALPYNFVAGSEGNPGYNARREALENSFKAAWLVHNPDFQDTYGYERDHFGEANMTLATNHIADYFDCLAYTIEMPFKDNANRPSALYGWNGERSKQLGASVLHPIAAVIDQLR